MQNTYLMKRLNILLLATVFLASCGGDAADKGGDKSARLAKLKKDRAALDQQIRTLETEVNKNAPKKASSVSVQELTPVDFSSYIEVQSQIVGDENVLATPQAAGTVTNVLVHSGQKVSKGQVLATLNPTGMDAGIDEQIASAEISLGFRKALYEKQKNLWEQNIGSEVQLMQAKAEYEGALRTKESLTTKRSMYRIVSPISGTVDNVDLKQGDVASPGQIGIRVVSFDKLKVEANLGENYIGKVKTGDPVNVVFPDLNDSVRTKLSFVSQSVDPVSRAITVQVKLPAGKRIYPNMSSKLKIANYENHNALVIPVSVIQKTAEGEMVYVVQDGKANATLITTGRNSNGMVEVLSGLKAGDKVVVEGFADLDNGEPVVF